MTILELLQQNQPTSLWQDLPAAIKEAKAALVGDSNTEHDALVHLIRALGEGEVPKCRDELDTDDRCAHALNAYHHKSCPCAAWQGKF